jgi:preprotein translocase subunit YajC
MLMGAAPGGAPGGEAPGPGAFVQTLIPFALIIGIFYFLIIRPQNKKQKDIQRMRSSLKKGDRIVTIGGIHGTISSIKETTVIVKVDEASKLEFSRSAIDSIEAVSTRESDEKKADEAEEDSK